MVPVGSSVILMLVVGVHSYHVIAYLGSFYAIYSSWLNVKDSTADKSAMLETYLVSIAHGMFRNPLV